MRVVRALMVLMLFVLVAGATSPAWSQSQTPPATPAPAAQAAPMPEAAVGQPVPDQVRSQILTLQIKLQGLAQAVALLQRELDATSVETQRLIQQTTPEGKQLDLQRWVYVPGPGGEKK